MEKWIKDALKKADADIIEMTWPRSNDRKFAKHVASVIKQRLLEAYAEETKRIAEALDSAPF